MLYESRSYTLHPGKVPEYLSLFATDEAVLAVVRQRLLGFWVTEGGRLNRAHHLWQCDSRSARAEARAAMLRHPAMGDFFSKVPPLLQAQESWLLSGHVAEPPESDSGGVYDRIDIGLPTDWSDATARAVDALAGVLGKHFETCADLRGHLFEVAGPLRSALFVLRSPSLDERDSRWRSAAPALHAAAGALPLARMESELVLPVPFSPWR